MAPSVEPITVPTPPRMLTPPTTDAVMMQLQPRRHGRLDGIELRAEQDAGDADHDAVDDEHLHEHAPRVEMPDRRAASLLPPTA